MNWAFFFPVRKRARGTGAWPGTVKHYRTRRAQILFCPAAFMLGTSARDAAPIPRHVRCLDPTQINNSTRKYINIAD